MLDVKLIRQNPEVLRSALKNRGGRYLPALEEFLSAAKPKKSWSRSRPVATRPPTRSEI